jgi:hypothetical protein
VEEGWVEGVEEGVEGCMSRGVEERRRGGGGGEFTSVECVFSITTPPA